MPRRFSEDHLSLLRKVSGMILTLVGPMDAPSLPDGRQGQNRSKFFIGWNTICRHLAKFVRIGSIFVHMID
jgi:hypothetical protein